MNKFKVGDKVQVVSLQEELRGSCDIPIGCVGEVVSDYISGGYLNYKVEFRYDQGNYKIWCWNESNLELFVGKEDSTDLKSYNHSVAQEGIKSDGGSSDYYFTNLPQEMIDQIVKTGGIEIKDIARYVYDNNADAFNIIKAQKRIIEANKGVGKAGITKLYDAKKISFFANEQYEAIKREGTNG